MSNEKSSSHERKVDGYLKPNIHKFFIQYVGKNNISKSSAINDAVRALKEKENIVKPK